MGFAKPFKEVKSIWCVYSKPTAKIKQIGFGVQSFDLFLLVPSNNTANHTITETDFIYLILCEM